MIFYRIKQIVRCDLIGANTTENLVLSN